MGSSCSWSIMATVGTMSGVGGSVTAKASLASPLGIFHKNGERFFIRGRVRLQNVWRRLHQRFQQTRKNVEYDDETRATIPKCGMRKKIPAAPRYIEEKSNSLREQVGEG